MLCVCIYAYIRHMTCGPIAFLPSSQISPTSGAPDVHRNQQWPSHLTTPSQTPQPTPHQYLLHLALCHFNCQSLSPSTNPSLSPSVCISTGKPFKPSCHLAVHVLHFDIFLPHLWPAWAVMEAGGGGWERSLGGEGWKRKWGGVRCGGLGEVSIP